jgi:hypothetical protein
MKESMLALIRKLKANNGNKMLIAQLEVIVSEMDAAN